MVVSQLVLRKILHTSVKFPPRTGWKRKGRCCVHWKKVKKVKVLKSNKVKNIFSFHFQNFTKTFVLALQKVEKSGRSNPPLEHLLLPLHPSQLQCPSFADLNAAIYPLQATIPTCFPLVIKFRSHRATALPRQRQRNYYPTYLEQHLTTMLSITTVPTITTVVFILEFVFLSEYRLFRLIYAK